MSDIKLVGGVFQHTTSLIFNLRQSGTCSVKIINNKREFIPDLQNDFMLQVSIAHSKDSSIYNEDRLAKFMTHVTELLNNNPFKPTIGTKK